MSSLTLLTATVVVLALVCCVPTGAFNMRMLMCNRTDMPLVDLNLDDFGGRWWVSHVSQAYGATFKTDRFTMGVQKTIPLKVDNRGRENVDFLTMYPTMTTTENAQCSKGTWLCEMINGKCSSTYSFKYLPQTPFSPSGHYVMWSDYSVLATDYNSTAVMLIEPYLNGETSPFFSEIQVFVRDPQVAPDQAVVDEALGGACQGNFLDVDSDFYHKIPNDILDRPGCFQSVYA